MFKNAGGPAGTPETCFSNINVVGYGYAGAPTFCGSCGDESRNNVNTK